MSARRVSARRMGFSWGTSAQSPGLSRRERHGLAVKTWAGGMLPVGSSLSLGVTEPWGYLQPVQPHSFQVKRPRLERGLVGPARCALTTPLPLPPEVPAMYARGRPQEKDPRLGSQTLSDLLWDSGQVTSVLWAWVP